MTGTQNFFRILLAFVSGFIFALGLWLGGMTDPTKVQGFLDLSGAWNPSLALVLGAAVLVSVISYLVAKTRSKPLLSEAFQVPSSRSIDRRLIAGAILFGAGWGGAGYCPAPALVSLSQGSMDALVFFISMLLGIFAYSRFGEQTLNRTVNS